MSNQWMGDEVQVSFTDCCGEGAISGLTLESAKDGACTSVCEKLSASRALKVVPQPTGQ